MFKNYLITAIRNIIRNKLTSFIAMIGLSMGIASMLLVFLFIQFEFSFDKFHKNKNSIFRIIRAGVSYSTGEFIWTNLGAEIAAELQKNKSIEKTVRLAWTETIIGSYNKYYNEHSLYFADPSIFQIFDFDLLEGDEKSVLTKPSSVLITSEKAMQYFGTTNCIGKTISFQTRKCRRPYPLQVTGILKSIPKHSSIQFEFLVSFSTLHLIYSKKELANEEKILTSTYIKISDSCVIEELQEEIDNIELFNTFNYRESRVLLEPLSDIHFSTLTRKTKEAEPDITLYLIYILLFFGGFILLISCINVMNLLIAYFAGRIKEIKTRQTIGATRLELIKQYLVESILLSFFSLLLALVLAEIFLPYFNIILNRELSIDYMKNGEYFAFMILITIFTGIITGIYPALYFSSNKKHKVRKNGRYFYTKRLRKILIIIQFAFSILLLIYSTIIIKQLNFIKNKELGFDKEELIIIDMSSHSFMKEYPILKKELLNINGVTHVTASTHSSWSNSYLYKSVIDLPTYETVDVNWILADPDYLRTYKIPIVEGRDFPENSQYTQSMVIVNERVKKILGLDEASGKFIISQWGKIIGVAKDFHYKHPFSQIKPLIIKTHIWDSSINWDYITIRLTHENNEKTIGIIKAIWKRYFPTVPFDYFFLSNEIEQAHSKLITPINIILKFGAGFAIFIACLGLFGLVSYETKRKVKEIGIRKVHGATSLSITFKIIKDFFFAAILANIIAWPSAYFFIKLSFNLTNYAYPVNIDPIIFLQACAFSLIMMVLTAGIQTIKASRANPADSLKYE